MSEKIINLENVSKKYLLKNRENKNHGDFIKSIFIKAEFYALQDISLTINDGDHVGFLGKNGAGKTILLKLISGIVYPSSGTIKIVKPIFPIFEYGAGFHPELTGRENIFLYGSLLGIRVKEIKRNFDEVVDFSELENFLELQLKYYSTGMKIRLAFSVASLLKPEILLLDEPSLGLDPNMMYEIFKIIKEINKQGTTIILVEQNARMALALANKINILQTGRIAFSGDKNEANLNVLKKIYFGEK